LNKLLSLNDFDFDLPPEHIAQTPLEHRSNSKLLCISRDCHKTPQARPSKKKYRGLSNINKTSSPTHLLFNQLPNLLNPGDVLVFNNTKVIKSRMFCYRSTGAKIECFFLKKTAPNTWEVLLKNAQRLSPNESLTVAPNNTIILLKRDKKTATIKIQSPLNDLLFIDTFGEMPLPPYIKTKNTQKIDAAYQTVFASEPGSVAAPTASLHFTEELFVQLKQKKIEIIYITLHVGLGTFNPIQTTNINEHKMHEENYYISESAKQNLNLAIKNNQRIIAVGTTVARCLESNIKNNCFVSGENKTSLFITPGYSFKCIHAMITNFHLPKSSLFILVSSFLGRKKTLATYKNAIINNYRFFSFGDAMFIA
jgi:S-adenosylmethionine:tRNA ribosyltransferase-isomerase